MDCKGRTAFKLESLHTGEKFVIENALVVPQFSDDDSTLPHSVDVTELKHFQGTHIPVAPERNRIDVLIGQSDKLLLSVLEENQRHLMNALKEYRLIMLFFFRYKFHEIGICPAQGRI